MADLFRASAVGMKEMIGGLRSLTQAFLLSKPLDELWIVLNTGLRFQRLAGVFELTELECRRRKVDFLGGKVIGAT